MIHKYLEDKISDAKDVLILAAEMSKFYYKKPLVILFSGGKDSNVVLQLAMECLKPDDFEVVNNHTTVDAPETVYYIRKVFKELEEKGIKTTIQYPRDKEGNFISMWSIIIKNGMPPTRIVRYCCKELKETTIPNRFRATGVREDESGGRKNRNVFATKGKNVKEAYYYYYYSHAKEVFETAKEKMVEDGQQPNDHNVWDCKLITEAKNNNELICNPIYKWTDRDVWEFINDRNIEYNPLYDEGFHRVGCVGCPYATDRKQTLERYPKYKQNYIKAFQKMLETHPSKNYSQGWTDGEDVYRWWIQDDTIPGQMTIEDFLKDEEE